MTSMGGDIYPYWVCALEKLVSRADWPCCVDGVNDPVAVSESYSPG